MAGPPPTPAATRVSNLNHELDSAVAVLDTILAVLEFDEYDRAPIDSQRLADFLGTFQGQLAQIDRANLSGPDRRRPRRPIDVEITGKVLDEMLRQLRQLRASMVELRAQTDELTIVQVQAQMVVLVSIYQLALDTLAQMLAHRARLLPEEQDRRSMGRQDALLSRLGRINMPEDVRRMVDLYVRPPPQETPVPRSLAPSNSSFVDLGNPTTGMRHRYLSVFGPDNTVYALNPLDPELTVLQFTPVRRSGRPLPPPDQVARQRYNDAVRAAVASGESMDAAKRRLRHLKVRSPHWPPRPSAYHDERVAIRLNDPARKTKDGEPHYKGGTLVRMWVVDGHRLLTAYNYPSDERRVWIHDAPTHGRLEFTGAAGGHFEDREFGHTILVDMWSLGAQVHMGAFRVWSLTTVDEAPFSTEPTLVYGPSGPFPDNGHCQYGSVEANRRGDVFIVASRRIDRDTDPLIAPVARYSFVVDAETKKAAVQVTVIDAHIAPIRMAYGQLTTAYFAGDRSPTGTARQHAWAVFYKMRQSVYAQGPYVAVVFELRYENDTTHPLICLLREGLAPDGVTIDYSMVKMIVSPIRMPQPDRDMPMLYPGMPDTATPPAVVIPIPTAYALATDGSLIYVHNDNNGPQMVVVPFDVRQPYNTAGYRMPLAHVLQSVDQILLGWGDAVMVLVREYWENTPIAGAPPIMNPLNGTMQVQMTPSIYRYVELTDSVLPPIYERHRHGVLSTRVPTQPMLDAPAQEKVEMGAPGFGPAPEPTEPRVEPLALKWKPVEQWNEEEEMEQRRRRAQEGVERLAERDARRVRLREAQEFRWARHIADFLMRFGPAEDRDLEADRLADDSERNRSLIEVADRAKIRVALKRLKLLHGQGLYDIDAEADHLERIWRREHRDATVAERSVFEARVDKQLLAAREALALDITARRTEIKHIEYVTDEPLQLLIVAIALSPLSWPRPILNLPDDPYMPEYVRRRALALAIVELPPVQAPAPPTAQNQVERGAQSVEEANLPQLEQALFDEAIVLAGRDGQLVREAEAERRATNPTNREMREDMRQSMAAAAAAADEPAPMEEDR